MTGRDFSGLWDEPVGKPYSDRPVFRPRFRARAVIEQAFIVNGCPYNRTEVAALRKLLIGHRIDSRDPKVKLASSIAGVAARILHDHTLLSWPEIAATLADKTEPHNTFCRLADNADDDKVKRALSRLRPINA